jgi:SAM-dependent methyltransferase
MTHWGDAYFGDLYLDSVEDLLTPRLSAAEADAITALLRLGWSAHVLDLACGHGRHVRALAGGARRLAGLDRSGAYLRRAASTATPTGRTAGSSVDWIQGDLRALPLRLAAFDAAYSWYSSLFMFDDQTNSACLAEAARVVRPGGRLLVHHANPLRLEREPQAAAARTLPDGARVEEVSSYDPATGVDRCTRRLTRASGEVLAATAELRYYKPSEWGPLSQRVGLRLVELTTTPRAGDHPPGEIGSEAPDLIAVLEKPT